jgi:quinol monooxygenase YgiN
VIVAGIKGPKNELVHQCKIQKVTLKNGGKRKNNKGAVPKMIKIVAKNFIKEDKISEFKALAQKLVAATNQNDAGCIHYELFQDTKNSKILTIIEEWESQAALDKHMAAKHFREIVPAFSEFAEKPGEINIYQKVE